MKRREFLKALSAFASFLMLPKIALALDSDSEEESDQIQRYVYFDTPGSMPIGAAPLGAEGYTISLYDEPEVSYN